jgi:hypothetical protein
MRKKKDEVFLERVGNRLLWAISFMINELDMHLRTCRLRVPRAHAASL